MSDYDYEDEVEYGEQLVRPFMVTKGRVRANAIEYPVETLVDPTAKGHRQAATLQFEKKRIIDEFSESIAVVEISARLELPLRATQVLVSEMIAEGLMQAHQTIESANTSVLLRIRGALAAL